MDDASGRYRPYLVMGLFFLVILLGTVYLLRRPEPAALTIVTPMPRATPTVAMILVDVRGAVVRPGVYSLPAGSRVQDALAQAGDVTADSDARGLNAARRLNDGEQIHVPTRSEAAATPVFTPERGDRAATPTSTRVASVNVNTATAEQLDTLPGIGPALAQRIVEYREQNGEFTRIQDLKQVRGIGDALFDQIKNLVVLQ